MGQSPSILGDEPRCPQSSQKLPSVTDSLSTPTTFPHYQDLPTELKIMICEHAFEPRHVKIWGQWIPNYKPGSHYAENSRYAIKSPVRNLAALSVNAATRAIALRFYRPMQFRCRLTIADKAVLKIIHNVASGPSTRWFEVPLLVSDSLAYFNTQIGDTVHVDLANENAYTSFPL